MALTSPFQTGEGTPGGPGGYNLDPTSIVRLGVLTTAVAIADERLLPVAMPPQVIAGETYDS